MQWKKIVLEDKFLAILAFIGILLVLVSFYLNSWLVFGSGIMIVLIETANSYYLKHIGEGLLFENKRERNRFFIGDQGEWTLSLKNQGLPIMKAYLTVYFDHAVLPVSCEFHVHQSKVDVSMPISLGRNEKILVKIPFTAQRRGLSRIRKMELHVPHFFGFGDTILEFQDVINMEAIVYPKTVTVNGLDKHKSVKPGTSPSWFSVFEDNMGPIGTRDYQPTDSFNRINWKASARRMNLQTKEFERINEAGAVILVNVVDGFSVTDQLEFLMSSAAEMAYFFHRSNIPYSLCLNIRSAGAAPFTFLPLGTGRDHLQKLLEILAIADHHSPTIPYDSMMFFYKRHIQQAPVMIHCGIRMESSNKYFQEFQRNGALILSLEHQKESAYLERMKMMTKEGVAIG